MGNGSGNTANGNYSFVGGGSSNSTPAAYATISGGRDNTASGYYNIISGGRNNLTFGNYASLLGGNYNTASSAYSIVGGGICNKSCVDYGFIGGGQLNCICNNSTISNSSVIGGGSFNTITDSGCSGILGGFNNIIPAGYCYAFIVGAGITAGRSCTTYVNDLIIQSACGCSGCSVCVGSNGLLTPYTAGGGGSSPYVSGSGFCSIVGNGCNNSANGGFSTVSGGYLNSITTNGTYSVISGGCFNSVQCCNSFIGAGNNNTNRGANSFIGAGKNNCFIMAGPPAQNSVIVGGQLNCISSDNNFIGSGQGNQIYQNFSSFIGSGQSNTICYSPISTISGGYCNTIFFGGCSVIGGGACNNNCSCFSTIGGGYCNTLSNFGNCSSIGGGQCNCVNNSFSTISGGYVNYACGARSTIAGGERNSACGDYSAILGGYQNTIIGNISGGFGCGLFGSADCTFYVNNMCVCGTLSKSSGSFKIPHPDPIKAEVGKFLKHSFVESPTAGDNIYRFNVTTSNCSASIELPDYYSLLNANDQVYVNAKKHLGYGFGIVNEEQTHVDITTNSDGEYNVLLIGTRKDKLALDAWNGTEVNEVEN